MSTEDSLGDRMKGYEVAARTVLPRRMPVIIRCDGKAFHTYTRGCTRPFDQKLGDVMLDTAKALVNEIQGAQLAYTQSDEISVLVHGYKRFNSESWFDNQVQKMASVAAGTASAFFTSESWKIWAGREGKYNDEGGYVKLAVFDARAFVVPEADVCNYFLWRQQDASRNSVQMHARSLYSHKECDRKNSSELQEMIWQKGQNWDDLPTRWKRGACVYRDHTVPAGIGHDRAKLVIDTEVPIFSKDRSFINKHLAVEEQ